MALDTTLVGLMAQLFFFFFIYWNENYTELGQGGLSVSIRIVCGNTVIPNTSEILEGGFIEHHMKNTHYPGKLRTTNEGTSTIIWQCNQD